MSYNTPAAIGLTGELEGGLMAEPACLITPMLGRLGAGPETITAIIRHEGKSSHYAL